MEKIILGFIEDVEIAGKKFKARIDSGAYMNSVDEGLVSDLGLKLSGDKVRIRAANGRAERDLVKIKFRLGGAEREDEFSVADRSHMSYKVLIGRNTLEKGFIIDGGKNG